MCDGETRLPLFHIPTRLHIPCTSPAPCIASVPGLPSKMTSGADQPITASESLSEPPGHNAENRLESLFAQNSTANSQHFHTAPTQRAQNRSICIGNTICCALYLTHPTEGGTFTTATVKVVLRSPGKSVCIRLQKQLRQSSPSCPSCSRDYKQTPHVHGVNRTNQQGNGSTIRRGKPVDFRRYFLGRTKNYCTAKNRLHY